MKTQHDHYDRLSIRLSPLFRWPNSVNHYRITLADAVNFLVERYELIRTDRKGFTWQEQTPFLTAIDILRARRATGLMNI